MYAKFLLLNMMGEVSKWQKKASTFTLLEGTSTLKDTVRVGNKFTPKSWGEKKGRIPARQVF